MIEIVIFIRLHYDAELFYEVSELFFIVFRIVILCVRLMMLRQGLNLIGEFRFSYCIDRVFFIAL